MRGRRILGPMTTGVLAAAGYWLAIRPWHLRWGATDAEVATLLPGDEIKTGILPIAPKDGRTDQLSELGSTHAVTIHAPISYVWPWLVQLGQGRGGFYSYTRLENLAGCRMENTDEILPQYQNLQVGDLIYLHPRVPPIPVTHLEPERALVLGSAWAFVLEPLDSYTTRLIVRSRGRFAPGLRNFLIWRILYEPAHFLMERAMLLGIKQRAEMLAVAHGTQYRPDANRDVLEDFRSDFTPG